MAAEQDRPDAQRGDGNEGHSGSQPDVLRGGDARADQERLDAHR